MQGGGNGWGVFWWYPEANTEGVSGLNIWKGGRYGLYDAGGALLPTIDVFSNIEPELIGDYNDDLKVDEADLAIWQAVFGRLVNNVGPDGNHDGRVDGADMLLLQRNFGTTAAASLTIPEPSAAAILVIGCSVYLVRGLFW